MNPSDFEGTTAGNVIKTGPQEAPYWAFIPNPLPPEMRADWNLTGILSQADRSLSEVSGLGRGLANPGLFIAPFLRREAVLSSRIEGTQSEIRDLFFYESGQLSLPGLEPASSLEADLREVFNYVVALEYGLDRLKSLPVSLRLIGEIHARLMKGVRGGRAAPGEFRTRQNWIGGETINSAVFVPPPVDAMRDGLDAFEKYLHRSDDIYPPLVRLAFIHYQFEAIHPFVDGNGRIGRLLLSLLLVSWNLLPVPLLYLSAYFERNRREYYDRLLAVSQKGAWEDWVVFFLKGADEQAKDTVRRLRRLQDLHSKWRERLDESRANADALRLMDRLFEIPVLTIPQAQKFLKVKTYHTAQKTVKKLVDLKILHPVAGKVYDKRFFARDILAAVAENRPKE